MPVIRRRITLTPREPKRVEYTPRPRTPAPAIGLVSALPLGQATTRVQPPPRPKEVRHDSEAWRRAVAALPCVLCEKHGQTQAAHRNEGKGAGMKTDDCWTASLCTTCHGAIDQGKDMTRDERRRLMDVAILLTVRALARNGSLKVIA